MTFVGSRLVADALEEIEVRTESGARARRGVGPWAGAHFRAGRSAQLPRKFLEAILLELKRHGILHSKKGKGGGYFLRHDPSAITLGQVIRVLEGPLALTPCVSQTAYMKCEECVDEETCGVRLAMKEVRDATAHILDNTTLQALNAQVTRIKRRPRKPRD